MKAKTGHAGFGKRQQRHSHINKHKQVARNTRAGRKLSTATYVDTFDSTTICTNFQDVCETSTTTGVTEANGNLICSLDSQVFSDDASLRYDDICTVGSSICQAVPDYCSNDNTILDLNLACAYPTDLSNYESIFGQDVFTWCEDRLV